MYIRINKKQFKQYLIEDKEYINRPLAIKMNTSEYQQGFRKGYTDAINSSLEYLRRLENYEQQIKDLKRTIKIREQDIKEYEKKRLD